MQGSLSRVRRVMDLQKPDRAPLFDLLPNDAVLAHFNHGEPVEIGDDRTGARALAAAIDGSRSSRLSPSEERTDHLPDGREHRYLRWTTWNEKRRYQSSEHYREVKQQLLAERWQQLEAMIPTA